MTHILKAPCYVANENSEGLSRANQYERRSPGKSLSIEFAGAMNASFRQIGKAVPPLLALAVGRFLLAIIARAVAKHVHRPFRAA